MCGARSGSGLGCVFFFPCRLLRTMFGGSTQQQQQQLQQQAAEQEEAVKQMLVTLQLKDGMRMYNKVVRE